MRLPQEQPDEDTMSNSDSIASTYGVHSEVGKLRKVLVCRPGLAHRRLTPTNSDDLLFDDVLWVENAQRDHADFVAKLRELVGPTDPEIAKHLRPHSIRAQFGHERVRNAVHCTDLPEDGVIECEYFFKALQDYQP